jgi:predicted nuclease of restriction endonuclease-like (RecB) superfamily
MSKSRRIRQTSGRSIRPAIRQTSPESDDRAFAEVFEMIEAARGRTLAAVNSALVDLYWRIGEYISRKIKAATWGDGVVEQLARYIQRRQPGLTGFTRANLFRMRQFYETYRSDKKVAPLVRQLPWSHNLVILGQAKRSEEREFYVRMAIRERWSRRDLERQLRIAAFERVALGKTNVSAVLSQTHPGAASVFKDSYVVEFLDLPSEHDEQDLHHALVRRLKDFLIELGRDFCFVGSEYPVQVGRRDFALDLLFFHRGLNCLCAIELKVGRFEPEHLGKLEFYLEALDRDVRKSHEGPSIGILLCASKDAEVVEYAMSRSASPTLIAEYQTQLPDKRLLQAKLHEFYSQTEGATELVGDGDRMTRRPRATKRATAKPRAPKGSRR